MNRALIENVKLWLFVNIHPSDAQKPLQQVGRKLEPEEVSTAVRWGLRQIMDLANGEPAPILLSSMNLIGTLKISIGRDGSMGKGAWCAGMRRIRRAFFSIRNGRTSWLDVSPMNKGE
jgi:hypothetical protein